MTLSKFHRVDTGTILCQQNVNIKIKYMYSKPSKIFTMLNEFFHFQSLSPLSLSLSPSCQMVITEIFYKTCKTFVCIKELSLSKQILIHIDKFNFKFQKHRTVELQKIFDDGPSFLRRASSAASVCRRVCSLDDSHGQMCLTDM